MRAAVTGILFVLGSLNVCPLRLKMLRMDKSSPKVLMLSDLSCIFAMLELAYMVVLVSTNLGEVSGITKPW